MPRTGKSYPNRSDLRALPKTTVPGQPYGAQAAQQSAMGAVPMANGALPSPQAAGPQLPALDGHHPSVPSPGSLPPLDAPTARPDEHVMSGVAAGPGPGPEALTQPLPPNPVVDTAAALNALGDHVTPQIAALRAALNGTLGNQVRT